jgi:hypothetical protein
MSLTLNEYIARDNARKLNVKKYFTKRNAKNDFYAKFFEKNATQNDKNELNALLSKIKIA